jgi:hypothetical protein
MQPLTGLKDHISGNYTLFVSCFNHPKFASTYQKPVLLFYKMTTMYLVGAVI